MGKEKHQVPMGGLRGKMMMRMGVDGWEIPRWSVAGWIAVHVSRVCLGHGCG
jgi:hypothetical protein